MAPLTELGQKKKIEHATKTTSLALKTTEVGETGSE